MRLHLRLEPDGRGLLMANAARAYHLNPSAALMAYLHLEGHAPQEALRILSGWFAASPEQLRPDYADLCDQIEQIGDPAGGCPLCEMDLELEMPFSSKPSAPYRMDLALTYRCNNDCTHCYNARSRAPQEMTTAEWKQILDQLWKIGIPHVVFTGGEPTLRPDLPELIAHAERNGQITGLNTNGRRLKDPAFVQALVDAGLDHVQITLESHDEAIHDQLVAHPGAWRETVAGLRNALASRLFVMTNTTLLRENSPHLPETMRFLADLGVPTVGFNALIYSGRGASVGTGLHEAELPALLDIVRDATDRIRAAPDLVHPHAILPVRPAASRSGSQGLHRRALRHVHRTGWLRAALPILLHPSGQHPARFVGIHLEPRPGPLPARTPQPGPGLPGLRTARNLWRRLPAGLSSQPAAPPTSVRHAKIGGLMNTLRNLWQRFFPAYEPLPAGIYHFTAPPDSDFPYRLHLRLEKNGERLADRQRQHRPAPQPDRRRVCLPPHPPIPAVRGRSQCFSPLRHPHCPGPGGLHRLHRPHPNPARRSRPRPGHLPGI